MGFSKMAFDPLTGLEDTTKYPTQPESEEELRKAVQAPSNQLRDYLNNTLITALESADIDESGADNIGSGPIDNITGTTVQQKLASLRSSITALSLDANSLDEGAITPYYLANLAVTAAKLAADAVETIKIKDAAVTTAKIADGAVTQSKIADNAISASQIIDGAVSLNKLAAGAVTGSKIAAGTITNDKLAASCVRSVTDSATAMDNIVNPGMYRIQNNAGSPSGTEFGNLLVIRGPGSDTIAQVVFDYDCRCLYWRSGNPTQAGGTGVWGEWKKILFNKYAGDVTIYSDNFEIRAIDATNFFKMFRVSGTKRTNVYGSLGITAEGAEIPYLQIGNYSLFVTSTGKLKIYAGTPSSDSNGTVVGTQS